MKRPVEPCDHEGHTPEFCRAYDILQAHARRMSAAEGAAQLAAHLKKGRKRESFGTGRPFPFIPSETLRTLCTMSGDPTMSPERALAYIWSGEAHAFDTDVRMRSTG